MATADEYASWLVSNSARRGTPQFDTVALAYEQAKAEERGAQERARPIAPPPPPSLGQQALGAAETALAARSGIGPSQDRT